MDLPILDEAQLEEKIKRAENSLAMHLSLVRKAELDIDLYRWVLKQLRAEKDDIPFWEKYVQEGS